MIVVFLKETSGERHIEFWNKTDADFRLMLKGMGSLSIIEQIIPLALPDDGKMGQWHHAHLETLLKLDQLAPTDFPVQRLVGELIRFGYRLGKEEITQ